MRGGPAALLIRANWPTQAATASRPRVASTGHGDRAARARASLPTQAASESQPRWRRGWRSRPAELARRRQPEVRASRPTTHGSQSRRGCTDAVKSRTYEAKQRPTPAQMHQCGPPDGELGVAGPSPLSENVNRSGSSAGRPSRPERCGRGRHRSPRISSAARTSPTPEVGEEADRPPGSDFQTPRMAVPSPKPLRGEDIPDRATAAPRGGSAAVGWCGASSYSGLFRCPS